MRNNNNKKKKKEHFKISLVLEEFWKSYILANVQDSHGCLAHLILKWYSAVLSCIHPVFTLILAFLSTSPIHTACGYTVHDCLLVCACVSLPYGYMGTHVCGVGIHMPVPRCACLTAWVCVCAWLLCQFEEHQGTTQEEAPGAHTQKHIHSPA